MNDLKKKGVQKKRRMFAWGSYVKWKHLSSVIWLLEHLLVTAAVWWKVQSEKESYAVIFEETSNCCANTDELLDNEAVKIWKSFLII